MISISAQIHLDFYTKIEFMFGLIVTPTPLYGNFLFWDNFNTVIHIGLLNTDSKTIKAGVKIVYNNLQQML